MNAVKTNLNGKTGFVFLESDKIFDFLEFINAGNEKNSFLLSFR